MPILSVEPGWGAIFCCDGAGTGGMCDPWCDNADPAEQERFIQSQHMGQVDFSIYPPLNLCDDPDCCGDDDSDDGCGAVHP